MGKPKERRCRWERGASGPQKHLTIPLQPSPSNGYTYKVTGGTDPGTFDSPVTTDLPPAPVGYEYRTFRLDTSDGLQAYGFLRVDVSETGPTS
jgi:hypothetical protein